MIKIVFTCVRKIDEGDKKSVVIEALPEACYISFKNIEDYGRHRCYGWQSRYYSDWNGKHWESESLDTLYEFLQALGYEMSDSEKALQNGTHELFIEEQNK